MVTKAAPPRVSPLCPGGTVVCLGSGPSLTVADVEYVRDKADIVIAVNDALRLAPWAPVLYACDAKWWYWHAKDEWVTSFRGLKYALDPGAKRYPGVQVLRNTGDRGLELDPTALRAGRNSGYQAINLAVHLGARRVILLGYDMRGGGGAHFFGAHPDGSKPPYSICLSRFQTLVEPLAAAGVEVVNCTPRSALTAFPCAPLREVLVAPLVEAVS
jgi:hypothetical protein